MEFRTLHAEELDKWFDHCMIVFNKGQHSNSFRQRFINAFYNDPWKDINNIFVSVDGDKIASTVRLLKRQVYILGKRVSMRGIASVSTKVEYRGRGLSSQLLKMAIERMQENGIQISMLFSSLYKHYGKLGWKKNALYYKVIDRGSLKDALYNVRPIDPVKDMNLIYDIYIQFSSKFNGTVVRADNQLYWSTRLKKDNWWVAENKSNNIVGYMRTSSTEGKIQVLEFGSAECINTSSNSVFDGMINKICSMSGITGYDVVFPAAIATKREIKRIEHRDSIMIKLVTPFEIEGKSIDSTEKLIDTMNCGKNPGVDSRFLFWDTDKF
ncbi:MAG: GNAT family N-acetyltransferase [Clostridiaceae bacterium]|nr:GNAT family N-acetyltransferase [Clostridiaceae bacterium]